MESRPITSADPDVKAGAPARRRPLKTFWRKVRGPIAGSPAVKQALASAITGVLRFVKATNRVVAGSSDPYAYVRPHEPVIVALWHGQHLMAPAYTPRDIKVTALFSRSADAELNALVAEKLGFSVVRGSGGRGGHDAQKGGARALIVLKRMLDEGRNVAMIADIPHGTPREAGLGIVTLARLSGRPILPLAVATSRRKVLEKSWDKTAINLPFGRAAIVLGDPVFVAADSDAEAKRHEVTGALNAVTQKAYGLVDAVP